MQDKKVYKIFLLFILLFFLSTFNPSNINSFFSENDRGFFDIEKIEIKNNYFVSGAEIKEQLQNVYGKNIFFIVKKDLLKSLISNNFIKEIEIKKKYPSTIKVKIYEEEPVAILNKKEKKFFICKSKKLIPYDSSIDMKLEILPSVFGENSEFHLPNFMHDLTNRGFPVQKIKKFYFFKIERWDVELINNQVIKFPFENTVEAIDLSIKLLKKEDFKKYKVIDLRINGKIVTD